MNLDPFEKQLRQRQFRQIPSEWRSEMLEAAEAARARSGADNRVVSSFALVVWLRELLWPCPQAWAGLAAVWIAILSLQFVGLDESNSEMAKVAPASPPEIRVALQKHHRLRNEMMNVIESGPVEQPDPQVTPRPRSNRKQNLLTA